MTGGTLVVGACHAGVQVAASLRDGGYEHSIVLVGAEPDLPYQRPPLSKAFLAGEADAHGLRLRDADFYADRDITLVLGDRVTHVDVDAGLARTAAGRDLAFHHLVLATGSRVRTLTVPGADLDGVLYLRDLADAARLSAGLDAAREVVVVGGGYIGLEAAAVARKLGKQVTVLEAAPRLVARSVAPVVSKFLAAAHRRRGTRVELGSAVTAIVGDGGAVTGVVLDSGEVLPAQVVVVGVGVIPRTELAEQIGLTVDGGVVVDRFARTSHPRVVAAGDCTVSEHPRAQGPVRLESVQNAQDQGRVAASTILGKQEPYDAVPWFWSDQADLKLQIAGLSSGYDHLLVRGSLEEEQFTVLYYREGQLIAGDSVNRTAEYMAVRRALTTGANIPAEQASDTSVALKTLVRPAAATPAPVG
ncbi:MAG: pyridine nucleotide-disulfide oxidoreductase [Frankiales bacterium]|nr:pyridine nucleotide-disulfide oxidoreductase [Frankiales bacterium]